MIADPLKKTSVLRAYSKKRLVVIGGEQSIRQGKPSAA